MANRRITEFSEATATKDDMYIPTDHTTDGTQRISVGNLFKGRVKDGGNYPEMTVGSAEQLLSENYLEDNAPYIFRAVPQGAGNREYDTIIGGSVVENQLFHSIGYQPIVRNNVTFTDNYDGTYTISTTAEGASADGAYYWLSGDNASIWKKDNHKYYFHCGKFNGSYHTIYAGEFNGNYTIAIDYGDGCICSRRPDRTSAVYWGVFIEAGTVITDPITLTPQITDLTQMFGTDIADYAYQLEQATAGSGIAWLKSQGFLTDEYIPFNAGEIKSVSGLVSHDLVGFNLFDENLLLEATGWTKNGDYFTGTADNLYKKFYANGQYLWKNNINYSGQICVTYTAYAVEANKSPRIRFIYTDGTSKNDNIVDSTTVTNYTSTSDNGKTVEKIVFTYGNDTTLFIKDFCINLSWSGYRNGEYEPYQKHSYPLDSSLTLRGIPELVDGKIQYDGDVYHSEGAKDERYLEIDMGSLDYAKSQNPQRFEVNTPLAGAKPPASLNEIAKIITSEYVTIGADATPTDKEIAMNTLGQLRIYDSARYYMSVADFKAAMSGVMLVCEKATPTTSQAEPFTNPQICDPNGTEEYVTTGSVPVGHETKYPTDLRKKLDELPAIPAAPTTDGTYKLSVTVTSGTPVYSWVTE